MFAISILRICRAETMAISIRWFQSPKSLPYYMDRHLDFDSFYYHSANSRVHTRPNSKSWSLYFGQGPQLALQTSLDQPYVYGGVSFDELGVSLNYFHVLGLICRIA